MSANHFDTFIGIDYSGAETPKSRLKGLQVYAAQAGTADAQEWNSPTPSNNGQRVNWTRREVADRLLQEVNKGTRFLAGIDHGFSMPMSYFARYGNLFRSGDAPPPDTRTGTADEFRLTERWTSSAKSVFLFDVQGSVAKSTHAGIPWLKWLRDQAGDRLHFWPFDGWTPARGKSVIVEVYPSIFRSRYPRDRRTLDQQDAYATVKWMASMDAHGALAGYFAPPLTVAERAVADLEGWILGVR